MSDDAIHDGYRRLIRYIVSQDRSGWDPYDGLNTANEFLISSKKRRLFSQYLHKFSPINFRPLFGVRKSKQLQAASIIGLALDTCPVEKRMTDFILDIVKDLKESTLKDSYGHHCWDPHGFPLQMRSGYTPVGTTDVIGNEVCGRLLYQHAIKHGDDEAMEMALDVADYILNDLKIDNDDSTFIRYKPTTPNWSCTYNASLIAAMYVLDVKGMDDITDEERLFIERCFRFVCERQKPEGYWCYSIDLRTGEEKHQVDFHQGFILDSILGYMKWAGFEEPWLSAYKKGMEFYRNNQFTDEGRALYRWPRVWPVNIHNQAQGILTFSKAGWLGREYSDFAKTVALWTIRNMSGPKGNFYYLKYPFFTNRIPYIRWSDASMAYALSALLSEETTKS